ncbi:hypothetical protein GCM10023331_10310 [Algivirga pacifica]|uniref:CcmD family protein n=2 Tax=Algivirga pacifica TaxID=1162670 RepID=A0ABP9D3S4_9BACT
MMMLMLLVQNPIFAQATEEVEGSFFSGITADLWVLILLGATIFVFLLIFVMLALILYTFLLTSKRKAQEASIIA